MFNEAAHTHLRDPAPLKDLHCIPYRILRAPCCTSSETTLGAECVFNQNADVTEGDKGRPRR
jgi:hypothetical protein